ncbi:MAG: hypothetical protein OXC83_10770 [Chloroflexi bacterium]|nr:hypothetical protein [Chloroflexota bacterium]
MIVGFVEEEGGGLFPYMDVIVRGPAGREICVTALIDTGFNAYISLPRRMVNDLGLTRLGTDDVILANAERDAAELFLGEVNWRSSRHNVPVHQIGDEPAVGTALLRQHNLSIEFVRDGAVHAVSIN